jgi:hypothetical protein
VNALEPLGRALAGLGELSFLGWLFLGFALLWLNARAGMPRAARDLRWRGLGFVLFLGAAVLDLGRGLVGAWPWPPQGALLGAALAPLLAGALLRRGRLGWAVLVGLSVPLFLLIALTAFFGLWLNLAMCVGGVLALALGLSVAGAVLTWRTPKPAQPAFGGFGGFAGFPGGFGGRFHFGTGRPGAAAAADDVVDVEARTVDEPPPPALPRRDEPPRG